MASQLSSRPVLIDLEQRQVVVPIIRPEDPCQQLGVSAHCVAVELKSRLVGPMNTLLYSHNLRIIDRADLSLSACGYSSKFSNIQSFCSANGCACELARAPNLRSDDSMPLHLSYSSFSTDA